MPFSTKRNNDGGLIAKATGIISYQDLAQFKASLYQTATDVKNIHYQILDYTPVTELDLSHEDIWQIALKDKAALQINPHMLIAIVSNKDVIYGLSRMWSAYTETSPLNTGVFRDFSAADEWIMQRQIAQALSIR
ncbi:hypothetical protein [Motilimonas eburnea]|uniref:hypothetical protein n=1 Tax=Motilimonas eburnea TaxID=1737488 RepID=UPI001E36AAAB|nr:hypothetical protein [Motilimonas eburnea]MCE2572907.1 hypothetical protein [Motilimonas eburnea]